MFDSKRKALLLAYCGVEKNKLLCVRLASQKASSHLAFNYPSVVFSLSYMSYRLQQHMWRSVQTQMLSLFFRKNRVLRHNWSKVDFIIVTSSLFFPPSIPISWTGPLAGPLQRKSWAFTRRGEQTNLLLTKAVCWFQYELTSSFDVTHSDVLLFTCGYLFSFYIILLCAFALELSLAHTCVLARGLKETLSCGSVEGKGWAAAVCCCQVV